jgi:hypothetical protein
MRPAQAPTMKPKTPPLRRRPKIELISSNGIAKELKRSTQGVIDALARLGIEPESDVPGGRYYRREVIDTVRDAMRAPNKTTITAGTVTSTPEA